MGHVSTALSTFQTYHVPRSTNHYALQFNAIKLNTMAAILIFHTDHKND